jgi:hypothetical protein
MLVQDIEYVIFRHPDLESARLFMLDYGLLDQERHGGAVYMRGYGEAPFSCVATRGEAAFIGMGFRVADLGALEALSDRFDSKIELSPRPGGGLRVVGSDPDGRRLEFVFGAARQDPVPLNGVKKRDPVAKERDGRLEERNYGPSHVLRLGRVAVATPHPQHLTAWYCDKLGLAPCKTQAPACALRLNREGGSDDRTLAIVPGVKPALDHVSFACPYSRDVWMGQMFLVEGGHCWDVGRDFHSDQIFDYWNDPAGFRFEHFVPGDHCSRDAAISQQEASREAALA